MSPTLETTQHERLIGDAIRRRWPLIIAAVVVAVAGMFAATYNRSAEYVATSKVLLSPLPGNSLSPDSVSSGQQITIAMQTEAGMVAAPAVNSLVAAGKNPSLAADTTAVSASVPPNTEIIEISYRADNAADARAGANAYAESFLEFRQGRAAAYQSHQSDLLKDQIAGLEKDLKKWTSAATGDNPDPEASARVQLVATQLATLRSSLGDVGLVSTSGGTVVTEASTPSSPAGLSPWMLLAGAGVLGLLIGLALAMWREHADDTVHIGRTLRVEARVLTHLPLRQSKSGIDTFEARKAAGGLRSILVSTTERPAVINVSSLGSDRAVVHSVADLATSLGEAGYRTTVVDLVGGVARLLDLVAPSLEEAVFDAASGAANASGGRVVVVQASDRDLAEGGLLKSRRWAEWVATAREQSDYVLVVSEPPSTPDGQSALSACESAIVLVIDSVTSYTELSDCVERTRLLGVRLLGLVTVPRLRSLTTRPAAADLHTPDARQGAESYGVQRDRSGEHTDGIKPQPTALSNDTSSA